jgi:hypothetical protein
VLFEYFDDTWSELRGVYTGYATKLDPVEDLTQDASWKGINTEHTWPQSKSAGEGSGRRGLERGRSQRHERVLPDPR